MGDKLTSRAEIAVLNIAHFSKLLRTPLDGQKRRLVERLLANEKAKLNESIRGAIRGGKSSASLIRSVQRQERP
jgi:hypothetical protein